MKLGIKEGIMRDLDHLIGKLRCLEMLTNDSKVREVLEDMETDIHSIRSDVSRLEEEDFDVPDMVMTSSTYYVCQKEDDEK